MASTAADSGTVTSATEKWRENLKDLVLTTALEESKDTLGNGLFGEASVVKYSGISCVAKKVHTSVSSKEEFCDEFLKGCLQLSTLRHPYLVQLLGIELSDDTLVAPVIISELLPMNLTTCLQSYPQIPDHTKYSILFETAVGLGYLHGQTPPIVHGHLCPNNILLSEALHVKISDYVRFGSPISAPPNSPYLCPEEPVSTTGDVFSLSDIMLHVSLQKDVSPLEYKHQRSADKPNEMLILTEIKRREKFLNTLDDSHPLKEIIVQCLADDPAERPSTEKILQVLEAALELHKPEYKNVLEMFMALGKLSLMKENVSSLNQTLEAKDEEISALKDQTEPRKQDMDAKEKVIAALREEIDGYKQSLQSKEGRIRAQETGIRAKESLLKAKDREIAAKKQVVAAKESLLKTCTKRIEILEHHVITSRKKGAQPLSPTSEALLIGGRGLVSPDNSTLSDSGLRPTRSFRGPSPLPIGSDGLTYQSKIQRSSSTSQADTADPMLAQILARQQKRLNENLASIKENSASKRSQSNSVPSSYVSPQMRRRSKTVGHGESTTPELKKILQRRKSFIEDSEDTQ